MIPENEEKRYHLERQINQVLEGIEAIEHGKHARVIETLDEDNYMVQFVVINGRVMRTIKHKGAA